MLRRMRARLAERHALPWGASGRPWNPVLLSHGGHMVGGSRPRALWASARSGRLVAAAERGGSGLARAHQSWAALPRPEAASAAGRPPVPAMPPLVAALAVGAASAAGPARLLNGALREPIAPREADRCRNLSRASAKPRPLVPPPNPTLCLLDLPALPCPAQTWRAPLQLPPPPPRRSCLTCTR